MKAAATVVIGFFGLAAAQCLAVELPLPFDTALGEEYRAELEFVMVPADALPSGCFLATDVPGALIYPASTNPYVTEDRDLIEFAAAMLMGARPPVQTEAKAAITALYFDRQPGREIGVCGIRYTSDTAAAAAHDAIIARTPIQRGRLVIKGPFLLTVWRDDGVRDEAFDAVKSHLENTEFVARDR